jgi:hypothetical protein
MTASARYEIPGGDAGAKQTLAHMRQLVNDSLGSPIVRDALQTITRHDPQRDDLAHAKSIRRFLQQRIRFLMDPRNVELLHTPEFMLEEIGRRGMIGVDCDDAAVLGASLAKNIGLRAYFQAVGFFDPKGSPYQHVYALVETGSGLLELDTTKPSYGAMPATRFLLEEV